MRKGIRDKKAKKLKNRTKRSAAVRRGKNPGRSVEIWINL